MRFIKIFRSFAAVLLAAALLLAGTAFAESAVPAVETDLDVIQKYGNIVLKVTAKSLLDQGYEYGDMLKVTIIGQDLEMPLCSNYSDVDNGALICRVVNDGSNDDNLVILAIYMGDLATTLGIAEKVATNDELGFTWKPNYDLPIPVTIAMKEKGGYAEGLMIHQLVRTNNREDYANLTDEEYANFRNVKTTGMGAYALFRTSSPIDPELNRNKEADEALNNAGVRTVMNLSDNEAKMKSYDGYPNSYYSQRDIIPLNLAMDFYSDEFSAGLAKGMEFFASHEGPYLVHCMEGKDRAGIVSAVLECLMGATAEEVAADYMVTYYNYYGIEPGTDKYEAIRKGNIDKNLARLFGVDDIYQPGLDLAASAETYLRSIGLDDDTIAKLKENLGKSYAE